MEVKLVDYMGSDKTVVDAARISFNKIKKEFDDKDTKLIQYLATHGHWTPFSHPQITLHVKAPIFVLRQLLKSVVGLTWNEVSRRYVDYTPEIYIPTEWRGKATDKKQGSEGAINDIATVLIKNEYQLHITQLIGFYEYLIACGVAPEQARMILPLSVYSEGHWTGSLAAFARVYNLRIQPDAQKETQDVARMIGDIIQPLYPISWSALVND